MKKILIPIIGLLVLVFLTPMILANLANSNIDKKIETFKKDGIKIVELKKDIGYLNTTRVFEVTFDKDTHFKSWSVYQKIIKGGKFIVTLKFRNLPVTTANFDITTKYIKSKDNKEYLKGLHFFITSKDFKTFKFKFLDYKSLEPSFTIVKNLQMVLKKGKYYQLFVSGDMLQIANSRYKDFNTNIIIKDLPLYLVDYNLNTKQYLDIGAYNIKATNIEENLTTHLYPNDIYKFEYKSKSKLLKITQKAPLVSFIDLYIDLKGNQNSKKGFFNLNIKWKNTLYKNETLDGGDIKANISYIRLKDINTYNGEVNITFDKGLFEKISSMVSPDFIETNFINNRLPIEIKNGELLINGNRIQ